MTNHTLEKTQWLVANSLTFGNLYIYIYIYNWNFWLFVDLFRAYHFIIIFLKKKLYNFFFHIIFCF